MPANHKANMYLTPEGATGKTFELQYECPEGPIPLTVISRVPAGEHGAEVVKTEGDGCRVRVRSTDEHGQTSEWSNANDLTSAYVPEPDFAGGLLLLALCLAALAAATTRRDSKKWFHGSRSQRSRSFQSLSWWRRTRRANR